MKNLLRSIIIKILNRQVTRLRSKRSFKVVAVAGSIGKTSTKFAIAQLVGSKLRVRYQTGNYNVPVTVPLVFFDLPLPSLFNPLAWLVAFVKIEWQLLRPYPYDLIIVELSTDEPGNLAEFKGVIWADIGILTAIAPEHMEFFKTISAVAKEELVIAEFSTKVLVNVDLCEPIYVQSIADRITYGTAESHYRIVTPEHTDRGYRFSIAKDGQPLLEAAEHPSIALPQLYSICAAVAVADRLGLSGDEIRTGLSAIAPVPGRMQLLAGVKDSVIIDDTYNSSPEAAKAALLALYDMQQSQKIALLGNMNELGEYSNSAHADVGALCDPTKLAHVVTLGPDANRYLAAAAEKQGCKVQRCSSPYEAARYIADVLKPGAAILCKGSQNKVFAEEAVKQLLQDPADADRLVRQSKQWMAVKAVQFPKP